MVSLDLINMPSSLPCQPCRARRTAHHDTPARQHGEPVCPAAVPTCGTPTSASASYFGYASQPLHAARTLQGWMVCTAAPARRKVPPEHSL